MRIGEEREADCTTIIDKFLPLLLLLSFILGFFVLNHFKKSISDDSEKKLSKDQAGSNFNNFVEEQDL